MGEYGTKQVGSKYTDTFKMYLTCDGKIISPFHDVPLYQGEYVNVVNEIPRFEQAKFEISKTQEFNPIVQDQKKGKMRFVRNIYPFFGYQFNYGALPQTWENPDVKDELCDAYGDNDPVDVLDIGVARKGVGEVYQAKILGALAMLDGGEADWKIVVIDVRDEHASEISSIEDAKRVFPSVLEDALRWFTNYKVPDDGAKNTFALGGRFLSAEEAKRVVEMGNKHWKELIEGERRDISTKNTTRTSSREYTADFQVQKGAEPDGVIPDDLKVFSFVN